MVQELPVPSLDETIERYLKVISVLQNPQDHEKTTEKAAAFLAGPGPRCQERLVGYAHKQSERGKSWLTDLWLDTYFEVKDPLQLVSNVAFQISWPDQLSGVARAADFIQRIASVHLEYLRGEMAVGVNARGSELTPTQWRFLAGGIRRPGAERDTYQDGPRTSANRGIVVLHRNHAFSMAVSDHEGQPVGQDAIAEGLQHILEETTSEPGQFTNLAHVGGPVAAELSEYRLRDSENRFVDATVKDALFVIDVAADAAGPAEQLHELAFGLEGIYAHKTTSYHFDLASSFVGVNLEHSVADGATICDLVMRAKAIEPRAGATLRNTVKPRALRWRGDEHIAGRLEEKLADYRRGAAALKVEILSVADVTASGVRLSHDAAMQWLILYSQLATWGSVRSTYEAVDMREFQAGRTESFRPHTAAAVEFCRALLAGSATAAQFEAAKAGHSDQVKAVKTGRGIERHLFALQAMARQLRLDEDFFTDDGYQKLSENFLSTTSLGVSEHIVRLTFAPSVPEGLGVNYTKTEDGYEFCLSYDAGAGPDMDAFKRNLVAGAAALNEFLGDIA